MKLKNDPLTRPFLKNTSRITLKSLNIIYEIIKFYIQIILINQINA